MATVQALIQDKEKMRTAINGVLLSYINKEIKYAIEYGVIKENGGNICLP